MSDRFPPVTEMRLPPLPPPSNRWLTGLAVATPLSDELRLALAASTGAGTDPYGAAVEPLAALLRQANDEYFRFDLGGAVAPEEPVRLTIASGGTSFAGGLGLAADDSTRKLVALVVLDVTAAEGGRLVLPLVGKAQPLTAGSAFVWPAFLDAIVELPDGGSIDALAAHAFGPAFR